MTRWQGLLVVVLVSLVAGACTDGAVSDSASTEMERITVEPNIELPALTVNVLLTDEGFEPSTIRLPAGRLIQIVLRNRGTVEHHFRIKGLVPAQLRWMHFPVIDEYDAASMTPEELARFGSAGVTDEAELAHIFHHLSPTLSPTKETSPSGVKPLGTEVHGYANIGTIDVIYFFPLQTGEYAAEDVLHPEITGTVIVYPVDWDQPAGA